MIRKTGTGILKMMTYRIFRRITRTFKIRKCIKFYIGGCKNTGCKKGRAKIRKYKQFNLDTDINEHVKKTKVLK